MHISTRANSIFESVYVVLNVISYHLDGMINVEWQSICTQLLVLPFVSPDHVYLKFGSIHYNPPETSTTNSLLRAWLYLGCSRNVVKYFARNMGLRNIDVKGSAPSSTLNLGTGCCLSSGSSDCCGEAKTVISSTHFATLPLWLLIDSCQFLLGT